MIAVKLISKFLLAAAVGLTLSNAAFAQEDVTLVLKQGVNGYAGTRDAFMDSQSPDTNYGTPWYMHLYMYNDNPRRSGLVKFDLTGQIPANSVINSATLSLWLYQVVDMDSNDYVYVAPFRVGTNRPWVENQVTWNRYNSSSFWSVPGCEGTQWGDRSANPDTNPIMFHKNSEINRYYHWDVTSSVQEWYNETANNNGWLMRVTSHDGSAGEGVSFNTKEGDLAYRPYLTINYTVIPEPGSFGALALGLISGMGMLLKKK